ncbi:MAG: GNAT family N-acetyltransferase [Betaproteobacteria bacterium]|nr:GNAT family N-acetyltransferase [Betaproteobacteria bacterium]
MNADKHGPDRDRNKAPEQVAIVSVAPADVERIAALAGEIWRRHYADIISRAQIEYMLKQRYDPRLIRAELKRQDLWWDKLLVGAEIAGFASYFLSGQPGEMKLDKLYVHQNHQRRGYGGRLIAHVGERAREQGCARLVLTVNRNNHHAIAAYRKHGFQVSAERVKAIGGGFVMDDYVMVRDI